MNFGVGFRGLLLAMTHHLLAVLFEIAEGLSSLSHWTRSTIGATDPGLNVSVAINIVEPASSGPAAGSGFRSVQHHHVNLAGSQIGRRRTPSRLTVQQL